jgi:probable rRNA maturation factor
MKALAVANRQSQCRLDGRLLRRMALCLFDELLGWRDYEISLVFLDARAMARLNFDFLRHEGSTDVITFDYGETPGAVRGEIFISTDDALAQAGQFRRPWREEIVRYVAHGALHLAGHDDLQPAARRVMKREENKLLKELSRRFDLRKL